jgi:hypothetical protein
MNINKLRKELDERIKELTKDTVSFATDEYAQGMLDAFHEVLYILEMDDEYISILS